MEFKQFQKIINRIEKHHKQSEMLYSIFGGCDFSDDIEDSLVDVLSQLVEDYSDWITWWIYETDFGRTDNKITEDGVEIAIETVTDLWELVQANRPA